VEAIHRTHFYTICVLTFDTVFGNHEGHEQISKVGLTVANISKKAPTVNSGNVTTGANFGCL